MVDAVVAGSVARAAALTLGFTSSDATTFAIAVSELATNMVKHAGGGRISIRSNSEGLEVVAEDRGPGMSDIPAALSDRHSRGRLLDADADWRQGIGCGLGAVSRLLDSVEIDSVPGRGTRIVGRKRSAR